MKKSVLLAMFALLLVLPIAFAGYEMTYNFNTNDVSVLAYNCLDQNCANVKDFGGSFLTSKTVNNGKIIVSFPRTLQDNGYALFFTSKGFAPKEVRSTLNTNGGPSVKASTNLYFNKISACRAPVQELTVVKQAAPFEPVSINTTTSLDANTDSAFKLINNGIDYIPPAIIYEYYGADTELNLEVFEENNSKVFSQKELFDDNESIVAGTNKPVNFLFVPLKEGILTIKVTSTVIDSQCSSQENMSAQSSLKVFNLTPQGNCYTLLNGLLTVPKKPEIYDSVSVFFDKISNLILLNSSLGPVQTEVEYIVKKEDNIVFSKTNWTLNENQNPQIPETFNFDFIPNETGNYDILVKARAFSTLCLDNPEVTSSLPLYVYPKSSQKNVRAAFFVFGENINGSKPVENAVIKINNQLSVYEKTTDKEGKAVFSLKAGQYLYNISAKNFKIKKGKINLQTNQVFNININKKNSAPNLYLPSVINVPVNSHRTFDLNNYVSDDNDLIEELRWTVSGNGSNINVTFTPLTLTIIANQNIGSRNLEFTVKDLENKTDKQTITVNTAPNNASPQFSALPALTITEDQEAVKILDLYKYVYDADNEKEELNFFVSHLTSSKVDVLIDDNRFITVIPGHNFFGTVNATINVSDGINSNSSILNINITPVNDAPIILSNPEIPPLNSQNYTLNLSLVFADPDNDTLTCFVSETENISFIITNPCKLIKIIPDRIKDNKTFNITASDSLSNSSLSFEVKINPEDQPPFILGDIPDLPLPNNTFDEDTVYGYDLTPYEGDLEDGPAADNNALVWSAENYNNTDIINISINSDDKMFITALPDKFGKINVTLKLKDSKNQSAIQNITVTIAPVNDAPVIHNLENKTLDIGELLNYTINATDVDNDTLTFFDFTDLFNISSTTGQILYNTSVFGYFEINITVCDDSGAVNNCTNAAFYLNITDTKPPWFSGVVEPADPSVYNLSAVYNFSVNVSDNGVIDTVIFTFNGINYTNATNITFGNTQTWTFNITNLSVGAYYYKWFANDTAGNKNNSEVYNFTVIKANNSLNLWLDNQNNNLTVAQNQTVNATAGLNLASNGLLKLLLNNSEIINGTSPITENITLLDAGNYIVTAVYDGDNNYNPENISYWIFVNDTTAPDFITTNITPANNSEISNLYQFSANATDNIAVNLVQVLLAGPVSGTFNMTLINNLYKLNLTNLTNGTYAVQWRAIDSSGNIRTTAAEQYIILPDITPPKYFNPQGPLSPALYSQTFSFNITAADNLAVDTVLLNFNGTLYNANETSPGYYELNIGPFPIGNYSYFWIINDTFNNINTTNSSTLEIIKGNSVISLKINSFEGNTSAPINSSVSFLVNVSNPLNARAELFINNSLINNDTTPYTNNSLFNTTGQYNITAVYRGNANVSAGSVTYFLTITPPITKTSIVPANTSHFNSSSFVFAFDMNVTTSDITSCSWDLIDVAQQSMSNSFSGNGTLHSAIISGLHLGQNNVYVACNNESTATNSDLVYFVDNVLINSNLFNNTYLLWNIIQDSAAENNILDSNIINSSLINTSTLNETNVTDSTVINSDLTGCLVINSFVDGVGPASNCLINNSPFTAINVSGDNWTIDNSTVINSYLNNTEITDSRVSDSNVTDSNIDDSWIINLTVENAVIDNNNVTKGNVTLPNGTKYSAPFYLPNVFDYPPTASFTPLTIDILEGDAVNFDASSSSDLNIGTPLNDNLSFLWTFHDAANSSLINPSKTYNNAGIYNVNLTVTDNSGQSDTISGTVNVGLQPQYNPRNNNPSGGSGGSGGIPPNAINITNTPILYTLNTREGYSFVRNKKRLAYTLYVYETYSDKNSAKFILGGNSHILNVSDTISFELTRDSEPDVDFTLLSVDTNSVVISAVQHGIEKINVSPYLTPTFDFSKRNTTSLEDKENASQKKEETIKVEAKIDKNKITEFAKKVFSAIKAKFKGIKGPFTKIGVVLLIVVLGIAVYVVVKRFYE